MMRRLCLTLILAVWPMSHLLAQEVESVAFQANTCEKALDGESPSSVRIRAVDKAVFLGLKSLKELDADRMRLNDFEFNAMIYRLVDDYVEDLSSKVTSSTEGKICVEVSGYINPNNIALVQNEFQSSASSNDETVAVVADEVTKALSLKPQNPQNLALVYINDLRYDNGAVSKKYATFLKDKMKDNPYYYLTDEQDLADYIITPKFLKGKVDALDATHKRLQMVIVLDVEGLEDSPQSISQNRFLLFSSEEYEQDIAKRLLKKLLEASAQEAVRQIERKEQKKLEQNALGRQE